MWDRVQSIPTQCSELPVTDDFWGGTLTNLETSIRSNLDSNEAGPIATLRPSVEALSGQIANRIGTLSRLRTELNDIAKKLKLFEDDPLFASDVEVEE